MNRDIYEVLDNVVGGLRLQVEFQPRVNSSLISSRIPFIRAIAVHNETGHSLSGVTLTAQLVAVSGVTADWTREIPGPIEPNSVTRIDDPRDFDAFTPILSGVREATPATLDLRAATNDETTGIETRILAAVELSAFNEWLNYPGLHAAIAAFIQPNTRTVTTVLRAASDLLLKRTKSGSLEGYLSGTERAHQIAGAIYEAIRAAEVTYVSPPASFEGTGQKVRTTHQVLDDRFGTCVDLAVMYAACLEAAGLFPLIFITAGHAFPGFYTSEYYGDSATVETVNALTNLVEVGLVHPVEMVKVGPGAGSLDFRQASAAATDHFRLGFDRLRTMVDVTRARIDGVRPMPDFGGTADVADQAQVDDARPFVAKSSLRSLSAVAEEEIVRGVLERRDDSPSRFKAWKRDLLDLSLRNPLLNMPHTAKVLDLVIPKGMLASLDDVVHSGKTVKLLGGVDSSELLKLAGARVANDASAEVMSTVFSTSRSVFSTRDDIKHRAQLRAMKREADTLEQETGSNYLYLTLGTLVHDKPSGGEARAPLFLLPVRIIGGLGFTPYSFKLDGDETAQPNLCLLEWLKTTKGLEIPELENPAVDDSGIAVASVFSSVRKRLVEANLPYRVDEAASIAILKFSTFQVWKDLDENWRHLLTNPVVQHLVERPGETYDDPAGTMDPTIDEATLRLPIAADGSQMAAIVRASSGQSFVLEGPPGTGKSQTITNLISHALAQGKKVLFVAEKQAALEVVKRRLDAVGVGAFGLELHGSKQSMKSIRDQLKTAMQLSATADENLWATGDARLRTAVDTLERYPTLVHDENAAGQSLWSAFDAAAVLGDGPVARVPSDWVAIEQSADVADMTRNYASVAARFGLHSGHHWLISGVSDPSKLDLDRIRRGLEELRAVASRPAELGATWREALATARPAAGLDAVVTLLDARAHGVLPDSSHLAYIDRPSWQDSVASFRQSLTAYLATHRVLADATSAAYDLPDLDALIAQSVALDTAFFFPGLRRRGLIRRLTAVMRDGFVVDGVQLTPVLTAIAAARNEASALRAQASTIQGLLLAPSWSAISPDAVVDFERAASVSLTAVWLNRYAHTAWEALPTTSNAEEAALRDLRAGWQRWLDALSADHATVTHWSGDRDWVDAWVTDAALWQRDLDVSGLLQLQRFAETRHLIDAIRWAGLPGFADQLASVTITPDAAPEALARGIARASLAERAATSGLDAFDADAQDRSTAAYLENATIIRDLLRVTGPARLIEQRPFRADRLRGEVAELGRQIDRKRGGLSFREITKRYPDALLSVMPCFLMSPGSVAHYLDPESLEFDIVIFDEASQIRVSQSIGAMGRGKSVVVVGDSRQMPPTRVMQVEIAASAPASSAEELVVEDLESILTEAVESGLPQLWLGWHYRSRDESLIAFSNARYYDGRLISLPSPGDDPTAGVSWRRVEGTFDRGRTRTNEVEAHAIVDEIMSRLRDAETANESLGVVCFNIQQRDLILNLLEDSGDLLVQQALSAEPGKDLFVKNLENVQGDERDTILFSLAFSVDPATGILPLNFGPLNLSGGERRLNVAITRAKKQIILFSSFNSSDIDPRRSSAQGIADLKRYLEFATDRIPLRTDRTDATLSNRGRFLDEVATAVRELGYETETDMGLSAFKVDLAVRKPGEVRWRLAIMVDGPGWTSRPTVADRDGSPALLIDLMGWDAMQRVWLPGWIRDRAGTLERIRLALEEPAAVRRSPALAAAVPLAVPAPADAIAATAPRVAVAAVPPMATGGSEIAPPVVGVDDKLTDFRSAPDSEIASQSVLNNMRMAAPAIVRIAAEVLEIEGPIPMVRLVSTVARRFGFSRIGDVRRQELTDVAAKRFTVIDGFVWPLDLSPDTWRGVRRTANSDERALIEISPEEIINAMEHVLREALSSTRDDLLRETSALLGYNRLTEQGRKWLSSALDMGIAADRFGVSDERLRVS